MKQQTGHEMSGSGQQNAVMAADVLSMRALNRATLERQLLLQRARVNPLDAVAHLVGMQAQIPANPYLGLWSRLVAFEPEEVSELIVNRELVRMVVMRGTLHLLTADDCLTLRPLVQPVLDRELARHREHGPALRGADLGPVLEFARSLLSERAVTGAQLRAALNERFPEHDPAALAYMCRNMLALVQVPPRGLWGRAGQVKSMTAEGWLGRSVVEKPSIDDVVLRYVAAYGPATVADVAAWSGLTAMREVIDRVLPKLRELRDERGREIFDLPDAPRPDPDTPAPPRFLPEYDNVLLSHSDRTRFFGDEDRRRRLFAAEGPVHGAVLCDGSAIGTWWIDKNFDAGASALSIRHVGRLSSDARSAITGEAQKLLQFLEPDAHDSDIRFCALEDRW
jgi:hypothetical protein